MHAYYTSCQVQTVLDGLATSKIGTSKRKLSDKQVIAVKKSAMHLLLLITKRILLRVGAKDRDNIVPKVSKIKSLPEQLNAFEVRDIF